MRAFSHLLVKKPTFVGMKQIYGDFSSIICKV